MAWDPMSFSISYSIRKTLQRRLTLVLATSPTAYGKEAGGIENYAIIRQGLRIP